MMAFSCRFCYMKVFWNTRLPSPKIGKPTLCNARGEEEKARLNFIASVKPSAAAAILGNNAADSGISVIFKVQEVTGGGNVY
jgi:hypothetical protein